MGGASKKNEKAMQRRATVAVGILMLLAGLGLLAIFAIDLTYLENLIKFFQNVHPYHGLQVAIDRIALTALGVVLVITGVRQLMRKKMSKVLYCLIPVLLAVDLMVHSSFQLGQYQRRDCSPTTNADGILEHCPYVDNELLGLFFFNLLVYTAGAVATVMIYRHIKSKNLKG